MMRGCKLSDNRAAEKMKEETGLVQPPLVVSSAPLSLRSLDQNSKFRILSNHLHTTLDELAQCLTFELAVAHVCGRRTERRV